MKFRIILPYSLNITYQNVNTDNCFEAVEEFRNSESTNVFVGFPNIVVAIALFSPSKFLVADRPLYAFRKL